MTTTETNTEFERIAALTVKANEAVVDEMRNGGDSHAFVIATMSVFQPEIDRLREESLKWEVRAHHAGSAEARVRTLHQLVTKTLDDDDSTEVAVCEECDGIRELASDEATPVYFPCPTILMLGPKADV